MTSTDRNPDPRAAWREVPLRRRLLLILPLVFGLLAPLVGVLLIAFEEGAARTAGFVLIGLVLVMSFGSTILVAVLRSRKRRPPA